MSEVIVVCTPVNLAELTTPGLYPDGIPGSTYTKTPCPECGCDMWLGGRGAQKVAEGARAVCMWCLAADGRLRGALHTLGGG